MSSAHIYKCHAPGCNRLCIGWLCKLHKPKELDVGGGVT